MPQKKVKKSKFEPKDLILAKMHGFPAWPSFVMPLNLVPDAILRAKKKTTNFCVIFIPDGDFYWMNEKSLEALSEELLDKKLEKIPANKTKKKTTGRTLHVNDALVAAKGLDFDDFMRKLDMNRNTDEEDDDEIGEDSKLEEEEEDEIEAAEADVEDEDVDAEVKEVEEQEEEEEEEDEVEAEEEEEEEEEPEDVLSRRSRNLKRRSATVTPQPATKKRFKPEKLLTPPINGKSENNNHNGHGSKKSESSPPKLTTNEEKQHQLWLCRIKLQRTLIQRNQPVTPSDPKKFPPPTVDELSVARLILNRLADFPMNVDLLKATKIHKVLKCILRNRDLEYSDSFKLHEKCDELLQKWSSIIDKLRIEKLKDERSKPSSNNDDSEISGIDTSLPLKSSNNQGGEDKLVDGISAKT